MPNPIEIIAPGDPPNLTILGAIHRHTIGSGFSPYAHREDLEVQTHLSKIDLDKLIVDGLLETHGKVSEYLKATDKLRRSLHHSVRLSNGLWWPPVAMLARYIVAILAIVLFVQLFRPGGVMRFLFKPGDVLTSRPPEISATSQPATHAENSKAKLSLLRSSCPRQFKWKDFLGEDALEIIIIIALCALVVPVTWWRWRRFRSMRIESYHSTFAAGMAGNGLHGLAVALAWECVPYALATAVILLFTRSYLSSVSLSIVAVTTLVCVIGAAIGSWLSLAPRSMRLAMGPLRLFLLYSLIFGFSILTMRTLDTLGDPSGASRFYVPLVLPGHLVVLTFFNTVSVRWLRKLSPLSCD